MNKAVNFLPILLLMVLTCCSTRFAQKEYDCAKYSVEHDFTNSDLIFQGVPVSQQIDGKKTIYYFRVEKVWKGLKSDTARIITGMGDNDYGMVFDIGKTYLVFSSNGRTKKCNRNALIDETNDILKLNYKFLPEYSTAFSGIKKELNNLESEYLNHTFQSWIKPYNFKLKSILFTTGQEIINKKKWFSQYWTIEEPPAFIIELSTKEKKSSGYDAILVTSYYGSLSKNELKKMLLKELKSRN